MNPGSMSNVTDGVYVTLPLENTDVTAQEKRGKLDKKKENKNYFA